MTEFHTNKFQAAHGKKPKGFGQWVFFQCDSGGRFDFDTADMFETGSMSFSDAKKEVKKMRPEWNHAAVGS